MYCLQFKSNFNSFFTGSQHGGGLDRLVDTNIDPMFLDCLEDELPSVTFDDKPADPTDLVETYENCTSINLLGRKKKKSLTLTPKVTSTIPETNLLDSNSKSSENLTSPNDISSTILRRLLTTPESEAAKRAEKLALKKAKKSAEEEEQNAKKSSSSVSPRDKKSKISPALPQNEDSSSECNSAFDETASIASSTASRKRKHRNPTGFPSPKKKKSKQKSIDLAEKKQHSPQSKKQSNSPQLSPVSSKKQPKDTSPKSPKKQEKENLKSTNKAISVQLKLGMDKNGLSLKKPVKETEQVNIAMPKRGRPSGKGNSQKNSSKKLVASMKTKKAKIVIPIIGKSIFYSKFLYRKDIQVILYKNCSSMDPKAFGFFVTIVPLKISKTDLTII